MVVAEHLAEAMRQIDQQKSGMVIIGVGFGESPMFELLHHVRIRREERAVPVVWGEGGRPSSVVVEGLDHAAKAMMANPFLDLGRIPDDETGNARLRRIVDYLIPLDGGLHQGLEHI